MHCKLVTYLLTKYRKFIHYMPTKHGLNLQASYTQDPETTYVNMSNCRYDVTGFNSVRSSSINLVITILFCLKRTTKWVEYIPVGSVLLLSIRP